jgi:minimal PKS acyl carrier protein
MIKQCAGVVVDVELMTGQPDLTFEELGVDSLGVLGVLAALENRYGIRMSTDAEQCNRPHQLRALVETTIAREASDAGTH